MKRIIVLALCVSYSAIAMQNAADDLDQLRQGAQSVELDYADNQDGAQELEQLLAGAGTSAQTAQDDQTVRGFLSFGRKSSEPAATQKDLSNLVSQLESMAEERDENAMLEKVSQEEALEAIERRVKRTEKMLKDGKLLELWQLIKGVEGTLEDLQSTMESVHEKQLETAIELAAIKGMLAARSTNIYANSNQMAPPAGASQDTGIGGIKLSRNQAAIGGVVVTALGMLVRRYYGA